MKITSILLLAAWALMLTPSAVFADTSDTYEGYAEVSFEDREQQQESASTRGLRSEQHATSYTSLRGQPSYHRALGKSGKSGKSRNGRNNRMGKSGKSMMSRSSFDEAPFFAPPPSRGASMMGMRPNRFKPRMRMRMRRDPFNQTDVDDGDDMEDMGNFTAAPGPAGNETMAPTDDPARTRPPGQPRRRRRRRRPSRLQRPFFAGSSRSMGKSMGKSRSRSFYDDFSRGGLIPLTVQGTLTYEFFDGTGLNPSNAEINALVDDTEEFYWDALDDARLTRGLIGDFRMNNLSAQYAPGGDLDTFILYFDAQAYAPPNAPIFAEDIARLMGNSNYDRYIQLYVWETEPFTQNIFWQANAVYFEGRAVFTA